MSRKSQSVYSVSGQDIIEKYVWKKEEEEPSNNEFRDLLKDPSKFSRFKELLERIPTREKDMLFLRYIMNKNQTQIARLYGVSQVAISYRLTRAIQRIDIFKWIIEIDRDEFYATLKEAFSIAGVGARITDQKLIFTIDIMWSLLQTSNQSETGRLLNRSQYCIRSRFFKGLKAIHRVRHELKKSKKLTQEQKVFYKDLTYIARIYARLRKNWHILLEKKHKWKQPDVII